MKSKGTLVWVFLVFQDDMRSSKSVMYGSVDGLRDATSHTEHSKTFQETLDASKIPDPQLSSRRTTLRQSDVQSSATVLLMENLTGIVDDVMHQGEESDEEHETRERLKLVYGFDAADDAVRELAFDIANASAEQMEHQMGEAEDSDEDTFIERSHREVVVQRVHEELINMRPDLSHASTQCRP